MRIERHQFSKSIGAEIFRLRMSHGISQEELSELVGLSYQQISKYESGIDNINLYNLVKLAEALKTTSEEIISAAIKEVPHKMDKMAKEIISLIDSYKTFSPPKRKAILHLLNTMKK